MKVRFKNSEVKFETNTPIEQKLFKNGVSYGWLLSLTFFGDCTSAQVDELLNEDSLSEITIYRDEVPETMVLLGYNKLNSCIVKYGADKNTVEIQLSK